jgi:hypothetical protein
VKLSGGLGVASRAWGFSTGGLASASGRLAAGWLAGAVDGEECLPASDGDTADGLVEARTGRATPGA